MFFTEFMKCPFGKTGGKILNLSQLVDNSRKSTFRLYLMNFGWSFPQFFSKLRFKFSVNFEDMSSWNPDGYFISNGPGDPKPLTAAQNLAKEVIDRNLPLFGICLGHQIIALANGISTYKMHNGHRGINHPVKNLITGKGEITSQNHGFAVDREDAEKNKDIDITHIHLNDNTIAGISMKNKNCFSVQYHPEASPGPHDASYLFDTFIENISKQP